MTPGIKKTFILLSIAVLMLLFSSVFGEKGFLHMLKLGEEKLSLERKNMLVQRENALLRRRIHELRHDNKVMERLVREGLGWVRDGEIVYRFKNPIGEKKNEGQED